MDVTQLVQTVAIYAIPVLFAITLHEAAHGYVARHFGDMTAYAQGRISLNPLRHIDPIGTIVIPLVIVVLSQGRFLFGWAKPVPVNYSALRSPKRDMMWVAVAGPASNLAMALGWVVLLKLAMLLPANFFSIPLRLMSEAGILVNLIFMFLNLLPILPLDGGRILASLLPSRLAWQYSKLERWGLPLLLLLIMLPISEGRTAIDFVLSPLVGTSAAMMRSIAY
ncbi:MAG TPA: site-2 protease family protein [Burkholderiales bacterium]|jgi:Zn-dependent protease|nr:site-2 protease family protein [Burkholderiales bacterium]